MGVSGRIEQGARGKRVAITQKVRECPACGRQTRPTSSGMLPCRNASLVLPNFPFFNRSQKSGLLRIISQFSNVGKQFKIC